MKPFERVAVAVFVAGLFAAIATIVGSSVSRGPHEEPLGSPLLYDPVGHRLHARISCGSSLKAKETRSQVTVTYYRAHHEPGQFCSAPDLSVTLRSPLAGRRVVDDDSGATIVVTTE
ncbi:hypothetical protein ACFV4F_39465 [Kitasatospora sp. NPDC059722]|uniref:hypothetical protein n=1 Tax=Kitasatospora sp. NPDC059722 TaxID=3346925 RepID=UPI003675E6C0